MKNNTFTLRSENLGGQATKEEMFNGSKCSGDNISPHLSWENEPEGTKSFAVTMHDPDAPTGSGFWHWLIFDIPSTITELKKGASDKNSNLLPQEAIQSLNDYGFKGYGGPCPPKGHGIHQYLITVHALKIESLGLDSDTNPASVGFNLWSNTLAKASIVIYCERK